MVWLALRRYSNDYYKPFPSEGGWLDQDCELMFYLDIIEEIFEEEKAVLKRIEESKKFAEAFMKGNAPKNSLRRIEHL